MYICFPVIVFWGWTVDPMNFTCWTQIKEMHFAFLKQYTFQNIHWFKTFQDSWDSSPKKWQFCHHLLALMLKRDILNKLYAALFHTALSHSDQLSKQIHDNRIIIFFEWTVPLNFTFQSILKEVVCDIHFRR